jgi:SOS-response transcriptional repressor LexA
MSRPFNKELSLRVYQTMIEYQHETGFNMTIREIADKMGYKSYSWVHYYIRHLVADGKVKQHGKQIRAISQPNN